MVQTTSEMLKNAIGESLRKGDLFTCYSPVQYLVLLNGAGQEHVLAVCERVERSLMEKRSILVIRSWGWHHSVLPDIVYHRLHHFLG